MPDHLLAPALVSGDGWAPGPPGRHLTGLLGRRASAHASSVEAKIKRGRKICPSHRDFAASRLRVNP